MANAGWRAAELLGGRRPSPFGSSPVPNRFACHSQETSALVRSFAMPMKLERESVLASEFNSMDRQIIQLDLPPTHVGITAALRRAFEAAASAPSDRDFADLLRRLN
jgi:hypothetical protein